MDVSILSNIATLSLFVGTLPSIVAIIKNRKCIDSFSAFGAIGILAGQLLFVTYFATIGDWITVLLMTPVTAFWTLVLFFKATVKSKKSQLRVN